MLLIKVLCLSVFHSTKIEFLLIFYRNQKLYDETNKNIDELTQCFR